MIPTKSTELATIRNMKVIDAARELGKHPAFVRIGLQRGLLPFGTAEKVSGNKYTYYINPRKFYEYIGKPLPNKYKEPEEIQAEGKYRVVTDPAEMTEIFKVWRCN